MRSIRFSLPKNAARARLDRTLASVVDDCSRRRLQEIIAAGKVSVDGAPCIKPATTVQGGQSIALAAGDWSPPPSTVVAEDIALEVVYEDADLIVVNKHAGMVVHPGHGNRRGTLQNALLHRHPAAARLVRAGIVHRLDKDTSGLLVAAKTAAAQKNLTRQFKLRTVKREYLAVVHGCPPPTGAVSAPIGRARNAPTKMAVRLRGRPAVTRFAVEQSWPGFSLLRCWLETGRTHQIRVHLEHLGYPVVGDPTYKTRARPLPFDMTRQALHATVLGLPHPTTQRPQQWSCPLPPDMRRLIP